MPRKTPAMRPKEHESKPSSSARTSAAIAIASSSADQGEAVGGAEIDGLRDAIAVTGDGPKNAVCPNNSASRK